MPKHYINHHYIDAIPTLYFVSHFCHAVSVSLFSLYAVVLFVKYCGGNMGSRSRDEANTL